MNKKARSIDGMSTRAEKPARRVESFEANEPTELGQTLQTHKIAHKKSKKEVDFGLNRDRIEQEKLRLQANEDFIKPVSTLDFDLSSKELKPDYSLKKRTGGGDKSSRRNVGKKVKKKHTARNVLIGIAIVLLLGVGAFAIWGNALIAKLTSGKSGLFELIGAISSNVKLKTDENGRTNVLVFGTSGYDMEGSEGDGAHDGAMLTDSIMVVSIDQETDDVAMMSFPRDLYVGNTCTATGKVNEVFWCANQDGTDEQGGAETLITTMEGILGIDIQYWVHLDWAALIQVVDSIGGITVTLDEDVGDNWTGTFIQAGVPTELSGERALGLARARHGTVAGDFTRGNSQQKILMAIQDKIVKNGIDFGQALNLVEAVGDNVRMNFSIDEIKTLMAIAKDLSLASMRQVPLVDYENNVYYVTTDEMNGISYVVPSAGIRDYSEIKQYVKKMFSSNPAVREEASIAVLNGSGEAGVANTEKLALSKEGYTVAIVDDAPAGNYTENYYVYQIGDKAQATAKALAEKYKTTVRNETELPAGIGTTGINVVVIIGSGNSEAK